jgi:2-polyprenyl-3-methyl-5-hydroxy-6-metoxy-1,4-benzoquinol methylase
MEKCLVCQSSNLEKLIFGYSQFNPKLFHHICICQSCGHIQQYPIFKKLAYEKINNEFFNKTYVVNQELNNLNNSKKLKKLDERLAPFIHNDANILDIGSGEGWCFDYFMKKGCNYFGIEVVDRLAKSIEDRGGKIIGKSVFDNYSSYNSRFDIIIFRHVLEHMLEPKKALEILRELLNSNGLIYLVLPNAEKPSMHKGFRSSFIRPVHISYFCKSNLFWLVNSIGLEVIQQDISGEIFCLLKKSEKKISVPENQYEIQKQNYLQIAKKAIKKDFINIVKSLPKDIPIKLLT